MKSKALGILGAAVLLGIVIGLVVWTANRPTSQTGALQFGAVLPESGDFAQLGVPKRDALLLAVEQTKVQNGPLGNLTRIVVEDSLGKNEGGVSALRKLDTVDGIFLVYVDITGIAYACAPVAESQKIIMFAGSAHPAITENKHWIFRVFTSGDQETDVLVDYLVKQGTKSVYILHVEDSLGEATREYLTRKFEAVGGKVVGKDAFTLGQKDCRAILTKARDSKSDRIVIIDYGITVPTLLQQAKELGVPGKSIVGNIGFVGPRVASLDAMLTQDVVFTGPSYAYEYQDPNTPEMKAFITDYETKYSKKPDYTAAFAYDAFMIVRKVVAEVGTDREAIRQGLLKVSNYPGVTGKITFRPNGDTITETSLMTYKDGKAVPWKSE